ncbi:MAG: TonB-dependent receptor [Cytophagaceae bacterium]|nr:TonB-dependent receptor [Cytophagaceae bacterium]MBL0325702.1 TonB-dependent receptor [Cytophagaceae bacterium]
MKSNIWILLLCVNFFNAFSQDSTIHELKELTVSANIVGTEIRSTGRNITSIPKSIIEAAPVKTLDGILQYAQNVDVRSRSSFGVQADISIRGGHYDQTLILVDGVKVNDPQTGHHSLNIPLNISQIEKIEVMQGGASRVYGPNAFSGVINIITKKIDRQSAQIGIMGGQHGLFGGNISAQTIKKGLGVRINGDYGQSGGYIANTQYNKYSLGLLISKVYKNGSLDLNSGLFSNHFGASNFYHPKFSRQYEEVGSGLFSVNWNHNFSNKVSGSFIGSNRMHHDMYDFDKYRDTTLKAFLNFHQTKVADIEYKLRYLGKNSKSAVGWAFRNEDVLSNRLGDIITDKVKIKNYEGLFYDKSKSRSNLSMFIEHQRKLKNATISAGTLLNYNSNFGYAWYPGLDIALPISGKYSVYASTNRSLRYPTFTELYLNNSTVKADPKLKPEKAWTHEIGLKYFGKNTSGTISIFYKKMEDAIDKVKRPEISVPTMENIQNINMAGVDFSYKIKLASNPNQFLQNLTFNYAYLIADRKEENFQSFYTLNFLRHKASVGVDLLPLKNTTMAIWYTFKKREGTYQWDNTRAPEFYKPVHLIDLRLKHQFKKHSLFFDINNLLNYKYYEFGFVQQPGIWASGGIILNF